MKNLRLISSLVLVIALFGCTCTNTNKRVVMLALDGICIDGYKKAQTPHLDALMAEGVLSLDTRDVMPSVTLPNWTSILTGSGPEQHGTVNNGWQIDKYILPPVDKDEKGYYPSIFKVLKDQVPNVKTAFYYNWKNLIYPYNKVYFDEYNYQEDDQYIKNFEMAYDFIVKNQDKPTAVFMYSVHTDHAGHGHGWMSSEYIQSIEEADVQIGIFIDKMKKAGLYDDTHFMFLSDHGGGPKGHGGVTTEEMLVPWGITGPGIVKGQTLKEPNNTVNTATTIARIFGCEVPLAWTGEVPESIFNK